MLAAKIGHFRAKGFDPRSISGLAIWLDAADYNASTGAWDDKSGNGRNFSQGVTNDRPTKTLTINGRDAVSFDGSNDHLQGPQVSFQQWSAFAVVRADRTAGDNGIITADPSIVGTRGPQFLRWSGTAYQTVGFQATNSARVESSSVTVVTGTARIVATVQGASAFEMWTNNTSNGSTTCTQQAYTAAMAIGAATYNTTPSASGFMDGDVGEILLYSRALTTLERESVQRYLSDKWGITLAPTASNADAQSWIDRVYANGGTVSTTTATAVNDFCNAIDAAGIRDRFLRVNLLAGNSIAAALVPLYRGQSLGGTQVGNATDTNFNFVAGDYVEGGAAAGLTGNGSTKYLATGLPQTYAGNNQLHQAIGFVPNLAAGYQCFLGARFNLSNSVAHEVRGANANFRVSAFSNGVALPAYSPSSGRNLFLFNTNNAGGALYDTYSRGAVLSSNGMGAGYNAATTANFLVFAGDTNGTPSAHYSGSADFYSIGTQFTSPSQVASYHAAIAAFRAALNRT